MRYYDRFNFAAENLWIYHYRVFIFEWKAGQPPAYILIWFYLVRAEVVLWWHCLFLFPPNLNEGVDIPAEAVILLRSHRVTPGRLVLELAAAVG